MNRWFKGMLGLSLAVAPLLQTEAVHAEGHEHAIRTIREEKSQKESEMHVDADKINQLLDDIDGVIASISDLEESIDQTETEIATTEQAIEEQKAVVRDRTQQVREQLRTIQTSEVNRNIIYTLLQSESLADMVDRALSLYLLTDASASVLADAQDDVTRLEELHANLTASRSELANQRAAADEKKVALDQHIVRVQETLNNHRSELEAINEREEKLIAEVEEEKQRQKEALAAEREEEQRVAATSLSASSAPEESQSAPESSSSQSSGVNSEATTSQSQAEVSQPASGWMSFQATGYSTQEPGLSAYTATGINLLQNPRVIAVDPSVIPLGSIVEVEGMGTYIAGDTGGAINGRIIDIHFPTLGEALSWGRRQVNIRILN